MSKTNLASSVHAFETSVGADTSFAEHLDQAVQSSPRPVSRPETQPSESSRTDSQAAKPKQASDARPQAPRTPVTVARSTTPQTKQNQSTSGKAQDNKAKTHSSDPSQVQKDEQKDEQRQSRNARNTDSRSSDSSRNADGRQTDEQQTSANGTNSFAQAVAQSAASQPASGASSIAQPSGTPAGTSGASTPAALLALLQASQSPVQAVAVQPVPSNEPNLRETNSSPTDTAPATPSDLLQLPNVSAAAGQASLTNSQASAQTAAQSTSTDGANSANQPSTPTGGANSLPSPDEQPSAPSAEAASTDSSSPASQTNSGNDQFATPSGPSQPVNPPTDSAAAMSPTAATPASASQANSVASGAHSLPSTNGQQPAQAKSAASGKPLQAETAESANLIKNLKLDAGQQEAVRSALEQGLAAAARAKTEPVAAALQQAAATATGLTIHEGSPTPSLQPSATDSEPLATGSDSGSPEAPATQGSASSLTDGSTGDATGDDSSAQSSSNSQGSNASKAGSGPVEILANSAFNSDAVNDVAPAAVHAVASATLQSNTGFDNASFKAPETISQNFNSAAQERAFTAWQSVSEQVGRVVNTAALNALQNGTEMRVQLRTDAFGSMDIRATLEGGKVGAAIGVESAEAHNALLGQLPALQQSLNERQVQLDQISVVSGYGQSGTDFGTGSGKQNGDSTPSGGSPQQPSGLEQVSEPASAPVTEAWQPGSSRGRLNVRA